MVREWNIKIPSLTGERKRRAYVYLPTSYAGERERRYPVLYMFDGHNLFSDAEATYGRSWRLADYLDYTDTQVIVAAVECDTVGNGRLSEYSPVDFMEEGKERITGRGKAYMDWLVGSFKPYIDGHFRTLPEREHTAISGSSMGGLMTLYALAEYGQYFAKGAALSPSLWINGYLVPFLDGAKFYKDTLLYMDYGEKEFGRGARQRNVYAKVSAELIRKGVLLTSRIAPNGTHTEASWEKQIPVFMPLLGFAPERR